MCTLTFVSLGENECVITSNRDEDPGRPTSDSLQLKQQNQNTLMLPVDKTAGGTWIAASSAGKVHCLLNGAFKPHEFNPPYKLTRGLVLLESLKHPDLSTFHKSFDFEGIQPFTLVAFDLKHKQTEEIRFTGDELTHTKINSNKPSIWSAAQLYSKENIEFREELFNEFIADSSRVTPDNLLSFHKQENLSDPDKGFIINREEKVKTTSIIQVVLKNGDLKVRFEDLLNSRVDEKRLELE